MPPPTTLPLYQVDAFADAPFRGNPAAVCPLEAWLPDETLQAVAEENNLSETAFFVPDGEAYELRWFTPTAEVTLCGHATLASAFVLFTEIDPELEAVTFRSRGGVLRVRRDGELLRMAFPRYDPAPCDAPPDALLDGLGTEPVRVLETEKLPNYYVVLDAEETLAALEPDLRAWRGLHPHGVAVTAPGGTADFVSRYFAPSYGIPEDPVTGSIHSALTPFWAERLGRRRLRARQISRRGGELRCELGEEGVEIAGRAVLYLRGEIRI